MILGFATVYFALIFIDKQDCTGCEELESKLQSQQREIESLQKQLNYWQNTTINILEIYPIDGEQILYTTTFGCFI